MGEKTKIGWTHHTFNAWIGCYKVSPACKHCYAEAFAKRTGRDVWGADKPRYFVGEDSWRKPLKWNRDAEKAGERRRVFCGSMMDVFELHDDDVIRHQQSDARHRLRRLIAETPWLDWLLLTKRPENVRACTPPGYWEEGYPPNVWLGTTVENQEYADLRIPHLLKIPARVRFLSCEPLLGPIDLTHLDAERAGDPDWCQINALTGRQTDMGRPCPDITARVSWVIAGGESGHHHREHQLEWSRSLRDQCAAAGVPFFFKQLGEGATVLTGQRGASRAFRVRLPLARGSKGEALDEIPLDLRVRQFPRSA